MVSSASEQEELQKKMDELRAEVDRRDHDIVQLQKNLKEAETVLVGDSTVTMVTR